jgi:hypothetical protein
MFIDDWANKYAKQNHSNCSKFPSLECMHFSLPITSDWVVAAVMPMQKYDRILEVLCLTFSLYTKLSMQPQESNQQGLVTSGAMCHIYRDIFSNSKTLPDMSSVMMKNSFVLQVRLVTNGTSSRRLGNFFLNRFVNLELGGVQRIVVQLTCY